MKKIIMRLVVKSDKAFEGDIVAKYEYSGPSNIFELPKPGIFKDDVEMWISFDESED